MNTFSPAFPAGWRILPFHAEFHSRLHYGLRPLIGYFVTLRRNTLFIYANSHHHARLRYIK